MPVTKYPARALFAVALSAAGMAQASSLKTLMSFTGAPDGNYPVGGLLNVSGSLYGSTSSYGPGGYGSIFKIDPTTGAETALYAFRGGTDGGDPTASMTNVGGVLFGTTYLGGPGNTGTVFKFDPATGTETIVHTFRSGTDGINPNSTLLDVNGTLYGTTSQGGTQGGGTVFKLNPATGKETVLYSFQNGADGSFPASGLVALNGALYGATGSGGSSGAGTVFKIDRSTGAETILCSFDQRTGSPSGLMSLNGTFYVNTTYSASGNGAIVRVDPTTGAETIIHAFTGGADGTNPVAAPIAVGGTLYGTTRDGGTSDYGIVYKLNPATGAETIIHAFASQPDGRTPLAPLLSLNGALFSATYDGGTYDSGAVFRIDLASGTETTLSSFSREQPFIAAEGILPVKGALFVTAAQGGPVNRGSITKIDIATGATTAENGFNKAGDPAFPLEPMLKVGGTFYGASGGGGSAGKGTVFAFSPLTGKVTTLSSFSDSKSGEGPETTLIYLGGALYGTTYIGGNANQGTIFKVDPSTGAETVLFSFSGSLDDLFPTAGLIKVKNVLYGTTSGDSTGGTIYKFDPATDVETPVYTFSDSKNGSAPFSSLLNIGGLLYGTTAYGGAYGGGTVFEYNPGTGVETVLHDFTFGADGAAPVCALIAVNGDLYGTATAGGAHGFGTVFKMDRTSGTETVLYAFSNGSDGGNPGSPLVSVNGLLYGGTSTGGAANLGTVFSLQP